MAEANADKFIPIPKYRVENYLRPTKNRLGETGLVWGIKTTLNVDNNVRGELKLYGYELPEKIKMIEFLDLAPEEILERKDRHLESEVLPEESFSYKLLHSQSAVGQGERLIDPAEEFYKNRPHVGSFVGGIVDILDRIFDDQRQRTAFCKSFQLNRGDKIMIINSHGGGDLTTGHILGEKQGHHLDERGEPIGKSESRQNLIYKQKTGNTIRTDELLADFDDPDVYASIVLTSCDKRHAGVKPIKVPVWKVVGYNTVKGMEDFSKTVEVVLPQTDSVEIGGGAGEGGN